MKHLISLLVFFVALALFVESVCSSYPHLSKIDRKLLETNQEKVKVIVWINRKNYHENEHKKLKELGDVRYEYSIIPAVYMEVSKNQLQNLAREDFVEKIVSEKVYHILRTESIPLIRADIARSSFDVNGTGIKIAILDTGVYNHTEFQNPNRIIAQRCTLNTGCPNNDENNASDDNGHGTHLAGIAAGKGGSYGTGVATNVSIIAVKVLNYAGNGTSGEIIAGIDWAVQNGANIISMSLGGNVDCYSRDDEGVAEAVDNATRQGVIVVVAAGNSGPNSQTIASPGCAKTVITVGAVNKSDIITFHSSRGPTNDNRTKPDLTAPGGNDTINFCDIGTSGILSTSLNNQYACSSGTSQATPFVSGVAALVMEKYNKTFGYFPEPGRVKAILLTAVNTTRMNSENYKQRNNVYGAGRIDAYEAVRIVNFTENDTISQNQQKMYLINVTNSLLKVTLVWMENSTTSNNLDLIVGNSTNNFTYTTDANDTVEQVFLYNITSGIWKVFVNGTRVTGTQEYFLASDSEIINDTFPPKWSNVSFNQNAERGEEINISVYWTDESNLSYAILSTNETGCGTSPCYNTTPLPLAGSFAWSNFSWVNSSLSNGTVVVWKVYANDTFGNVNSTQEFNFTIVDTKGPFYFNIINSTDVAYALNKSYQFNITLQDYSGISTVIFEWNNSNITVTTYREVDSVKREYYINKTDLAVGNYTYRWLANDTLNNWNFTLSQVYNITKATPNLSLIISPSNSTVYPAVTLANGSIVAGDSGANLSLYRNGSLVNSSVSLFTFENITLGAGVYNYTLTYDETQNYTFASLTNITRVYPGATSVSLWLNGTQDDRTYSRGSIANLTAHINVSSLNITLSANFTGQHKDINSSTGLVMNLTNTSSLDFGTYNITAYFNGSANYTASSKTFFMTIVILYTNTSISTTANQKEVVNAMDINTTLTIVTNTSVTDGSINITITRNNPTGVNLPVRGLNKYLMIQASDSLTNNLTYAIINVSYTNTEVEAVGIDENFLRLYYWNSTSWIKYDTPNGGVNTEVNYVWANTTHFSNFTIGGLLANNQPCTDNANCSSGICYSGRCVSSFPTTTTTVTPSGGAGRYITTITTTTTIPITITTTTAVTTTSTTTQPTTTLPTTTTLPLPAPTNLTRVIVFVIIIFILAVVTFISLKKTKRKRKKIKLHKAFVILLYLVVLNLF